MVEYLLVGNAKGHPQGSPRGIGWIGASATPGEMPAQAPGDGWLWVTLDPPAIYASNGVFWKTLGAGEDAQTILGKLLTVDGPGSGVNADLLDGFDALAFALTAHRHDNATTTADGFQSAADKAKAHDRLHGLGSQDHSDVRNAPQDGQALFFRSAGAGGMGYYHETPGAATVPLASETEAGRVEEGTTAEIQAGAAGALYATVAKLKAELDRRGAHPDRITGLPGGTGAFALSNVSVGTGGILTGDLRGVGGVPADTRGVLLMVHNPGQAAVLQMSADSANVPAYNSFSPRAVLQTTTHGEHLAVPLGTGAQAGKVRLATLSGTAAGISAWVTGYWR